MVWVTLSVWRDPDLQIHTERVQQEEHMTYEQKVRLFHANRYLMPLPPLGTKNWTEDDYIRYIDQHGRWCPDGSDRCEMHDTGSLKKSPMASSSMKQVTPEYCPYCGKEISSTETRCSRCGHCALCG